MTHRGRYVTNWPFPSTGSPSGAGTSGCRRFISHVPVTPAEGSGQHRTYERCCSGASQYSRMQDGKMAMPQLRGYVSFIPDISARIDSRPIAWHAIVPKSRSTLVVCPNVLAC